MKKIFALVLVAVMMLAMSAPAFAAGSNTITVSGAQDGETYKIYKMLDLSVGYDSSTPPAPNAYRYTLNGKWGGFWTTGAGKDYIDTNTAGSVTYVVWKDGKNTAADMEAFGKAAAKFAEDNHISPDGDAKTVGTGVTAEWTGLDNGYYLVTSTYGTAASVASTPANPVQTIREKNPANTVEKKVLAGGTAGSANHAAVGDTITFVAKVTIAKHSTNVVYRDTMGPELTWTGAANVKVYTAETMADAEELAAANYTVAAGTAPETFNVTFTNTYVDSLTALETNLWIKYTAVLNDKAAVSTSATNAASVTWGDHGSTTGTTTSTTGTSTHKFELLKYDGTDTAKSPLAGAKFQLYTAQTGGTALPLAVSTDGTTYRVVYDATDLPTGYSVATDNKIVTLNSGNITIEGVSAGDYYLEETDAPAGYNKLTARQKVTVADTNNTIAEVVNNSGVTLPSTGGIGTTIFYVIGAILVVGATVVLVSKKRMEE